MKCFGGVIFQRADYQMYKYMKIDEFTFRNTYARFHTTSIEKTKSSLFIGLKCTIAIIVIIVFVFCLVVRK